MEGPLPRRSNAVSVAQVLQTRKPFTPSMMTTLVMVVIFSRFVTTANVARAALWSMQGMKNE